jgi:rhodanese-related sulfurtransferase
MTTLTRIRTTSAPAIRQALLARQEIALIDLREEADFARGHPLFAAQIPLRRLEQEARWRLPRADVAVVVYDAGEGLVEPAIEILERLGFTAVCAGRWPRRLAGPWI